jgi:hypothetical protein
LGRLGALRSTPEEEDDQRNQGNHRERADLVSEAADQLSYGLSTRLSIHHTTFPSSG